MPTTFKLINDFDEFLKICQPWNELVEKCEVDHAFMKHEWFECWVKNIGKPDNLMIPTAWLDGQLVAVAPMRIIKGKFKGFPVKVLGFLSSAISPRCNFIVHESLESRDFFDYIFGLRGFSLISTHDLEENLSITEEYFKYLKCEKKRYFKEASRMSPYLLTELSWDEYWKTLSKSFRANLNTGMNRLNRDKSCNVYKVTTYDKFAQIFGQLVETSSRSWKGKVESDLESTPAILSFYKDFTRKSSKLGLFELWVLEIGDQIIAFSYHLKGNNALSGIRTDFDLGYKFYKPGNILTLFFLKDLFNRPGIWEYDLGGQVADYKLKWTNKIRKHTTVIASNSLTYGNLIIAGKATIWPAIKRLIPKIQ